MSASAVTSCLSLLAFLAPPQPPMQSEQLLPPSVPLVDGGGPLVVVVGAAATELVAQRGGQPCGGEAAGAVLEMKDPALGEELGGRHHAQAHWPVLLLHRRHREVAEKEMRGPSAPGGCGPLQNPAAP